MGLPPVAYATCVSQFGCIEQVAREGSEAGVRLAISSDQRNNQQANALAVRRVSTLTSSYRRMRGWALTPLRMEAWGFHNESGSGPASGKLRH